MLRTPPAKKANPVLSMAKADLENECERLGLSTMGTIAELRARILEHLQPEEFQASPKMAGTAVTVHSRSFIRSHVLYAGSTMI